MMAARKTGKAPSRSISDVTLESRQTAARYPINKYRAPADAERFDELLAKMRAEALKRRAVARG